MSLAEFKAWLEGFSEGFGEAPSAEQWAKIKAKIAKTEVIVARPAPLSGTLPHYPPGYFSAGTPVLPPAVANTRAIGYTAPQQS